MWDLFEYRGGVIFRGGRVAGSPHPKYGYWLVRYPGGRIRRSRLVWEMHHGPIPEGLEVDHINQQRDDDRIENLRLLTRSENGANRRPYAKSGFAGVRKMGLKWEARITIDKKYHSLGTFPTPEEAHEAFKAKHREVYKERSQYV